MKRSRPRDRDRKGRPTPLAKQAGKAGDRWGNPESASRETCLHKVLRADGVFRDRMAYAARGRSISSGPIPVRRLGGDYDCYALRLPNLPHCGAGLR